MKRTMRGLSGALALVAVLVAPDSSAGLYVGGAGLYAERDSYDDVDGAGGGKAILGYRLEPIPLILEANYIDAGNADINGTDFSLGFTGYSLTVGYFMQMSRLGSGLWIRGGFYDGEATLDEFNSEIDKSSSSGPIFGIGGVWKLDHWIGLRLEYESLADVEDFADNESLGIVSLGLVIEFPDGPRRRARYDRYERPPPPAYAPPPRPYRSSAPPPPSSGDRLVAEAELKSQPRGSSPTLTVIPAGAAVQPGQVESNVEGDWTFVLYGRYSGWVQNGAFAR